MSEDVIKEIKEFIGNYNPGVVSFLSTVNKYNRSTIRQVSTFVDFDDGWNIAIQIGICIQCRQKSSRIVSVTVVHNMPHFIRNGL